MVKIEQSPPIDMKDVVANALRHPGGRMVGPILIHQQAIFRFKPENTIQHIRSRLGALTAEGRRAA